MKKHNFLVFCAIFLFYSVHATIYFDIFRYILNEGRADFLSYLYYTCKMNQSIVNAPQQLSYAISKKFCNDSGEIHPEVVNAVLKHIQLMPKEYAISLKKDGDVSVTAKLLRLQEQFGVNAIFELWRICKFYKGAVTEKNLAIAAMKSRYRVFLQEIKNEGLCNQHGVISNAFRNKILDICLIKVRPALLIVQDKA